MHGSHPTRFRFALLLPLAALAASGCVGSRPIPDIAWPPPPEVARVKYVQALRTEDDLKPSLFGRILRALVPHQIAAVAAPTGLALSPDEQRLYVACGSQGRIVVFDFARQRADFFPFAGNETPASTPGVALDADENLYVSDRLANLVFVFDKTGAFVRKFGKDRLIGPNSLAFDRKGQVLYVISGGTGRDNPHTIEAFSPRGEHIRTLGGARSEQPGSFNFPQHLTVAPDGDLWVSDMLNFRVQIFSPEGSYRSSFGVAGTGGAGAFDKIKGIAFDTFGNVYVVDAQQGVHIFNSNFQRLMLFGNQPVTNVPGAIVIDSRNRIFVTDFGLNGVHQFQLVNTEAKDSFAPDSTPVPAARPAATTSPPPAGG